MHELLLDDAEAGKRIDRFLRELLPGVPLAAIFRHLRQGDVRVDGRKAAPSLRLAAGMRVTLRLPDRDLAAARAGAPRRQAQVRGKAPVLLRAPRVVYRDGDVLVVSKPAGLATQPGSGLFGEDLVAWLDAQDLPRTATFAPAPAHRLDRGTSGLVAVGMSPLGLRGLTGAFRDDLARKVYLAVVHGVPPDEGAVDLPLAERRTARRDEPKVVADPGGRPARTEYRVIDRGSDRALLRVTPRTGRKHQIRAHLAAIGHPIVGDRRYGSAAGARELLLHAAELELPHPRTGERLCWVDPPPPHFAQALHG